MLLAVGATGVLAMLGRARSVPVRRVGVMGRLLVVFSFVMFGRFGMVPCGMGMMLGRLSMVLGCLLGHRFPPVDPPRCHNPVVGNIVALS